ncbi:MAG TPA: HNH endonuclease [Atlantibacter hermannii]|uniref:HNH endonuclease signature motif containing protein n=1 Tax=Atlantibacter hermannii TaxID=565 RepID=UPI000EDAAF16|nr:HNH endonuclease signature motif containing protein [Atlantibacter hermannii]HCC10124.1 HNH endonuclease [Atlantibacter hermannii]
MRFVHSPEMRAWMRANYMLTADRLAVAFNHKFGCSRTPEQVHAFRKQMGLRTGRTGSFEKGHTPFNAGTKGVMKPNSGSFQRGARPSNHRPVGSERVSVDGYVELKVAEPNTWKLKHREVWKNRHGNIPVGMCVTFKDNNPLNCALDNLELITRAEHAVFNKHFGSVPVEMKQVARSITRLKILSAERSRS